MPSPRVGNIERQDSESEHIGPDYTGDNISAKKMAGYVWNSTTSLWERQPYVTTKTLNTQVVAADTGLVVNAVLHGLTTAGGGSYVDVKVNPSGALATDASGSSIDIKNSQVIKFASVSISASGDNSIVAAVTSKKIKVLSCTLVSSGIVSVKWRSGTTDLSGAMPLVANSGFVLPASAPGQGHYLETAVNTALNINLSGAVQVSGLISYYEEA